MAKEINLPARLREIIHEFLIYGDLESILPLGKGHINDTFLSQWNQGGTRVRYTHQRINEKVFLRPGEVMDNISRITRRISASLAEEGAADRSRRVLSVVPSRAGKPFVRDAEGGWWRTYCFIERSHAGDIASSPKEAELLGRSISLFQKQLAALPEPRLYESIPDFHNMETRYLRFHHALEKDEFQRAEAARPEVAFLLENEERGGILIRALREGRVPERICHNDAKLGNILLDDETGEALCVIDLDTVMPGSGLFDFGDLVRTVTITAPEDEPDPGKVRFDPVFFKALLSGYFSEARDFLVPEELALLREAGRNITQIMGLRFLTDFLEGDPYYHTARPGHNLDRARVQIALILSMDSQQQEAERLVREVTQR